MAKRRKVEAPSAADLNRIEEEFRRETSDKPNPGLAPIAQVSAEAAREQDTRSADIRAAQEKDKLDAEAMREAAGQGRLIVEIPLGEIQDDALLRDRTILDPTELQELKYSIAANGLRLPIELFEIDNAKTGQKYGLLSGFRRVRAYRDLLELTKQEKYQTIKALIRDPDVLGGTYAAMVEENEIRASLSHFERGRIAVIAAQQGVFSTVEDAVATLFKVASKSKRSKIRSFSLIFEELGDLLTFPEDLKERDGLRLATALRNGAESQLRDTLTDKPPADPIEEWAALEPVVADFELSAEPSKKGGRPKASTAKTGWHDDTLHLSSGVTLRRGFHGGKYTIQIGGKGVDGNLVKTAMEQLQYMFEKSDRS